MRVREYISPTALKIWESNPEEYYNQYLVTSKIPRSPQTKAMSIGSAFDAFVKAYLHDKIYGPNHKDAASYDLDALFEAQVEKHNHDFAREYGSYVYSAYMDSGAMADLMYELDNAASEPRFEMEIRGVIKYDNGELRTQSQELETGLNEVVLLGKPDIYFVNGAGGRVILDWKVGGLMGKGNMSPMAGYRMVRDCGPYITKNNGQSHKDFVPVKYMGMEIDCASYLERRNADWAAQLCTYAWLLGETVGSETICAIDQIVGQPAATPYGTKFPYLRIAHHRTRVSREFQIKTMLAYQELWKRLHQKVKLASGELVPWFFRELSPDESWNKCKMLDQMAMDLYGPDSDLTDDERWLVDVSKGPSVYHGPAVYKGK